MVWKTDTYSGWGRAIKATGDIARPERQSAMAVLSGAPAVGNRRSYGDACLNDGGRVIDMTRLDRILDFDVGTGVLHAEAGVTLGDLIRHFGPRGWMLPVVPGTGFATLGGAIAMDVHGKNHHDVGTFGQHVTEVTLQQQGKTVKLKPRQVAFKATMGGLGQTGAILSAKFQLTRIQGEAMTVRERRMEDWDEFIEEFSTSTAPYSVGWIDASARGAKLGRGILEEADVGAGLTKGPRKPKSVPFDLPGFALASPVVRAFNAAYFHRVPASGRTTTRSFEEFFFPLDRIHDWNRLYGKRGFHQFQCVVPADQAPALRAMLSRIAGSGLASPLAVLKRMGPGNAGMMSFPMEGWTLAVDFPARRKIDALITDLEDMAVDAGGRIYLAKDALSRPAQIREMYPNLNKWAAEVEKADPNGDLMTDLVRRLNLRDLS